MTIAPAAYGSRVELPAARLRRNLAGAPVGQHGLVEAALAWQRLRPPLVEPAWANQYGYLPIVRTPDEDVAARVARLLSGLAFCVVSHPDGPRSSDVAVVGSRHRPVIRALTLVWRDTQRQFAPAVSGTGALRETAIALWRMASLIADGGPNPHLVTVGAGTPGTAEVLLAAAARLGVRARIQRVRRRPAVVVDEPDQVRLLFATLLRTHPRVQPAGAALAR